MGVDHFSVYEINYVALRHQLFRYWSSDSFHSSCVKWRLCSFDCCHCFQAVRSKFISLRRLFNLMTFLSKSCGKALLCVCYNQQFIRCIDWSHHLQYNRRIYALSQIVLRKWAIRFSLSKPNGFPYRAQVTIKRVMRKQ